MYEADWDKVADAHSQRSSTDLSNSFIIRGKGQWGGCLNVQGKLSEYGVCSYVQWDPGPPFWRFLFDTHLTRHQVFSILGHTADRWQVTVE